MAAGDILKKTPLPEVIWDVSNEAPEILTHLNAEAPWVTDAYKALRIEIPRCPTCRSFETEPFFRPEGHSRAFYQRGPDGVIAFKGTEVCADDVQWAFGVLSRARRIFGGYESLHSLLELFPIDEHKIPMAMHVREALDEATVAASFQMAHRQRYGHFAKMPLPLLVVRWPSDVVDLFRSLLLPRLSDSARAVVERLFREGLASYIYHYRGSTLRGVSLEPQLRLTDAKTGYLARNAIMRTFADPEKAITGWIQLAGRMLALGYSPVTLANLHTGQCVQWQNAVVDGGLVDVDSLQPLASITSDRDFHDTMMLMLFELTTTIKRFLIGRFAAPVIDPRRDLTDTTTLFVYVRVFDALRETVERESAGHALDPRLVKVLASGNLFEELHRTMQLIYPAWTS